MWKEHESEGGRNTAVSMFAGILEIKQLSARQHTLGLTSRSLCVCVCLPLSLKHTNTHIHALSSNISLTLGLIDSRSTADKEERDERKMNNTTYLCQHTHTHTHPFLQQTTLISHFMQNTHIHQRAEYLQVNREAAAL